MPCAPPEAFSWERGWSSEASAGPAARPRSGRHVICGPKRSHRSPADPLPAPLSACQRQRGSSWSIRAPREMAAMLRSFLAAGILFAQQTTRQRPEPQVFSTACKRGMMFVSLHARQVDAAPSRHAASSARSTSPLHRLKALRIASVRQSTTPHSFGYRKRSTEDADLCAAHSSFFIHRSPEPLQPHNRSDFRRLLTLRLLSREAPATREGGV